MKRLAVRGAVLTGLLLLGAAPAQQEARVYIQGGVFTPQENAKINVYAERDTVLTLRRVINPETLFLTAKNPNQPVLTEDMPTQLVKTVRLGSDHDRQVDLGRLPSGVYMFGAAKVNAVVLVSNLGLAIKRDATKALAYTAELGSGAVRESKVWAVGVAGPRSTAGGVTTFALGDAANDRNRVYLARSGNDWAVSGGYWNSYSQNQKVRGYVYTDRPVYRPGQHVDFKGVLRRTEGLAALADQDVTVTVTSPDNEQVYRKTLRTNAFGSISGGFDLSEAGRVGTYRFEVRTAGSERSDLSSTFAVEAYQKPEYEVTIQADKPKVVQGDRAKVKVSAKYLFGGAVSGGRVKYRVVREPTYAQWWMDDVYDRSVYAPGSDKLIIQEDTRLGTNGDLEILLPLEKDAGGQPVTYRIEAEVEDEARRPFSAQTRLTAFPSSLTVQAGVSGYVFDAGKPIEVNLRTQDLHDQGRAAPVLLELVRDDWERVDGQWKRQTAVVVSKTVTTNAKGELTTTLSAPRGGGYRLRATVKDAQGRQSRAETFMWVFKAGESWNWYSRELGVRFDKDKYQTGETATVLVTNPTPGSAVLLTLEGERLRNHIVLNSKSAVLRYQFKVTEDMSPNVFVGAASFGGQQFYQGEASVKVVRRDAALKVTVKAEKAKYQPGDTGRFTVQVTNGAGQGVPSELAFSVVDQAIYLIRPDDSPSLQDVFEAPRFNVVGTNSSRQFYFYGYGNLPMPTKPAAPMAAESAADSAVANRAAGAAQANVAPRVDFKDTLLWIPNLVTDASGKAVVEVKFPDNLTTWVSTARAHTVAPRFGQATASTVTTKDVVARLSLPVFLVRGDQVTLSGIVNNTLNRPLTGNASLQASGLSGLGGAALKTGGAALTIPALGRQRFDVQVGAKTLGSAQVTFTARTPLGNDALRLPVPVKARGYDLSATSVGGAGTTLNLTLPADSAPESTHLRLDLTPSLLAAVSPALEYLIGYPYGCTEQTMSRFLPALLARQSLGENGLPPSLRQDLNKWVEAGLARLYTFQHSDGGWGFWEHDQSSLEMTAYVVEGLLRAKAAGISVRNSTLDRGLNFLAQKVDSSDYTQAERARTFRVLAMTGHAKPAELLKFASEKLQPYALAQVALALHSAAQPQAALAVLKRLKDERRSTSGGALVYWEKPKRQNDWYWYWDDNNIQVTAAALEALATLEPGSDLIPRTSQWLLLQRRGQRWLSTQDTTSVIIAALKTKAAPVSNANVQVLLNGKNVGSVKLEGRSAATLHLNTPLPPGRHTIDLRGAPAGLIASAQLRYSREPAALSGIDDRGVRVLRTYSRLTPNWDKANKRYVYSKTPLLQGGKLQRVQVGDLIHVDLTIQTKESARYLLVSDPIPAGMKALDDRSLVYAGERPRNDWWGWWYWYSGRDLLDDRVDLYADYVPGKQAHTMTYILRAQTPGTFTALPSHAFLMYDPDVEGYGPAATFTVVDRTE